MDAPEDTGLIAAATPAHERLIDRAEADKKKAKADSDNVVVIKPKRNRKKATAPPLLYDVPNAMAALGIGSATSFWRLRHNPKHDFPAPINVNGRPYWRVADIENWIAAQPSIGA